MCYSLLWFPVSYSSQLGILQLCTARLTLKPCEACTPNRCAVHPPLVGRLGQQCVCKCTMPKVVQSMTLCRYGLPIVYAGHMWGCIVTTVGTRIPVCIPCTTSMLPLLTQHDSLCQCCYKHGRLSVAIDLTVFKHMPLIMAKTLYHQVVVSSPVIHSILMQF